LPAIVKQLLLGWQEIDLMYGCNVGEPRHNLKQGKLERSEVPVHKPAAVLVIAVAVVSDAGLLAHLMPLACVMLALVKGD
jgi:hypothetical protein